jgi:hypothetical protein
MDAENERVATTRTEAVDGQCDIELLGFLDAIIHDKRFHIEPALPLHDYTQWVKRYYGRCFRENPDGESSDSSYSAGWDFLGVFISLWDDGVSRDVLTDLKLWLAALYKEGDSRLRTCIVNATLEHLFERKPIRKFFADWKNDPDLVSAYDEACLWDRQTPLSNKRVNPAYSRRSRP